MNLGHRPGSRAGGWEPPGQGQCCGGAVLSLLFLGTDVTQVPEATSWLSSLLWGSGHNRVCGAEAAMPGETSQLETQRGCTRLPVTFFLLALLPKGKRSSKTRSAKKWERFL